MFGVTVLPFQRTNNFEVRRTKNRSGGSFYFVGKPNNFPQFNERWIHIQEQVGYFIHVLLARDVFYFVSKRWRVTKGESR